MAMLIKGDEIDALVARYCAMTGENNKSEAVRRALAAQIELLSRAESLTDRVAKIQQEAAALGFVSTDTDLAGDKAFMDDMWGEN